MPDSLTEHPLEQLARSGELSGAELAMIVRDLATQVVGSGARRVLLVPPDQTRLHSRAGEIVAELVRRTGVTEVHLRAGDVLVQRGTIHNWINRGTAPCVMAFTLIDAKPVEVGGKMLHATG